MCLCVSSVCVCGSLSRSVFCCVCFCMLRHARVRSVSVCMCLCQEYLDHIQPHLKSESFTHDGDLLFVDAREF